MKSDATNVHSSSQRYAEGLNRAIQVHVKERILIVPDSSRRISYSIAHEPNPIVTGIRLDLGYRCTSIRPSLDGRLHLHGVTGLVKCEIGRSATDRKLLVGDIVKHVALVRMRLAPGVFSRRDVVGFGKAARGGILCWNQVARCNCHSMRSTGVIVARMIVWVGVRWENTCEWVHPRAGADEVLVII